MSTAITVSYFGNIRRRMGCKQETVSFDNGTVLVRDVLERLVELHGDDLRDWMFNQFGWLDPRLLIFVDGEHLNSYGAVDDDITNADKLEITIALPMNGG